MTERSSKKWSVLCTKPRNESKVTERLFKMGLEVYTPTIIGSRQWSDRNKKVTVSMVLVQLLEKEVATIFEIPGAVRFLFEHGKRASVSNEKVLAMKSYLEATKVTDEKCLVVGDLVEIPLLGQKAILLSKKGKSVWLNYKN